ncbi:Pycsar system effector family protein [Streptomyces sp. TRM64462]|uniref:Pycsar system effector family protein n=1 Tax=Streptomyces sp. TRM64462 TaxID=2741726 RepID=UPI0015860DF4|nr:Pycsar system effector family protein [Streptomyces sp. TRM64462]
MSATVPEPGSAPAQGTAERLLGELRREAARADTKGSVLVAAQGMAAAALVGVLAARDWHPSDLSAPGQVMWWAGAVCFLLSLISLLMAVVPRYRTADWQPGAPLTHFADIQGAARRGPSVLEEALRETDRAPRAAVLASLLENSRIVSIKYAWLRVGMAGFTAALVLLPGALLAG